MHHLQTRVLFSLGPRWTADIDTPPVYLHTGSFHGSHAIKQKTRYKLYSITVHNISMESKLLKAYFKAADKGRHFNLLGMLRKAPRARSGRRREINVFLGKTSISISLTATPILFCFMKLNFLKPSFKIRRIFLRNLCSCKKLFRNFAFF